MDLITLNFNKIKIISVPRPAHGSIERHIKLPVIGRHDGIFQELGRSGNPVGFHAEQFSQPPGQTVRSTSHWQGC